MGGEILAMEQAKVLGTLLVSTHSVGHACARVDASQRGADESEEYGKRFDQHETLAVTAEHRVADNGHHVADRSCRSLGVIKAVKVVHEVIRGEVLDEVHEQALNRDRQQNAAGNVLLGVLGFLAERGYRLKAHQEQNRDRRL